jgi:hypothetical protein
MEWIVELQSASPDDELLEDLPQLLNRCLDSLGPDHSGGSCDADGWAIRIAVEADDMRSAWADAMKRVFRCVLEDGLPVWPLVSIAVISSEYAAATNSWFRS